MNELLDMSTVEVQHFDEIIPDDNIIYSFYCIILNPSHNLITVEFDKSRLDVTNQSFRVNNLQSGNFGRAWVIFSDNLDNGDLLAFSRIDVEDIHKIKVI